MRSCSVLFLLATIMLLPATPRAASPRTPASKHDGPVRRERKEKPRSSSERDPERKEESVSGATFRRDTLEELVFAHVNAERRRHGLRPFAPDQALLRAARAHSGDMAARNYFSHDAPRGFLRKTGFGDRLRGNGVVASRMAENIAMLPLVRSRSWTARSDGYGRTAHDVREDRLDYNSLAAWAVQQWMESPGHRKNILNPALGTMGIGVALGRRGQEEYVYLTQDFGGN